jgi:hypothetical protein
MALAPELSSRLPVDRPNQIEPVYGHPCRKKSSYLPDSRLWSQVDQTHPFFRFRSCNSFDKERPQDDLPRCGPHRRFALLVSGSVRHLKETAENLDQMLISKLPSCDVFIFAPDDGHAQHISLLDPVRWKAEPDHDLEEGVLRNGIHCSLKTGVQRYLQQLNGLKQCHRLLAEYQAETGCVYDVLIRCRPDILFVTPVEGLERIDLRYLHVPDFHGFDGVNDRFAVGSPQDMALYMNKLDEFEAYVTSWFQSGSQAPLVSAEMFTAGQLRMHGIRVRQAPFRFNRVREGRVKTDVEPVVAQRKTLVGNNPSVGSVSG